MTRILMASAAVLALMSSGASAQTRIIEQTTTTVQPAVPVIPAPGETITKRSKAYNADGSETITQETVKRSSGGGVSTTTRSRTLNPDGSSTLTTKEQLLPKMGSTTETTTTKEQLSPGIGSTTETTTTTIIKR